MPVSTVVKDQVFYLPTYLRDNPLTDPESGRCSLFLHRLELRERSKMGPLVKCYNDVVSFPDEESMAAAIEFYGWTEAAPEADGDLTYVPDGWAPPGVPVERGFNWKASRKWWDENGD